MIHFSKSYIRWNIGTMMGSVALITLLTLLGTGCGKTEATSESDSTSATKIVAKVEKKVLDGKYVGSGLYKYVVRVKGTRWSCTALDDWEEIKESISGTMSGEDLLDESGSKIGDCDGRYVTLSASGTSILCSKE